MKDSEVVWHSPSQFPNIVAMQSWLLASDSMSERLRRVSQKNLRVHILTQAWQIPETAETLRLGLAVNEQAFVRSVELFCGDEIWMFARTIFPKSTLTGEQRALLELNEKPLGDWLFNDPSLERSDFELAMIDSSSFQQTQTPSLIARRSVFYSAKKPLLLTEIFTPICVAAFHAHV